MVVVVKIVPLKMMLKLISLFAVANALTLRTGMGDEEGWSKQIHRMKARIREAARTEKSVAKEAVDLLHSQKLGCYLLHQDTIALAPQARPWVPRKHPDALQMFHISQM